MSHLRHGLPLKEKYKLSFLFVDYQVLFDADMIYSLHFTAAQTYVRGSYTSTPIDIWCLSQFSVCNAETHRMVTSLGGGLFQTACNIVYIAISTVVYTITCRLHFIMKSAIFWSTVLCCVHRNQFLWLCYAFGTTVFYTILRLTGIEICKFGITETADAFFLTIINSSEDQW